MPKKFTYFIVILSLILTVGCGGSGGRTGGNVILPPQNATISGTVAFLNSPAEGSRVFIGVFPPNNPVAYSFYEIPPGDLEKKSHTYRFTGLDFGTYWVRIVVNFGGPPVYVDPESGIIEVTVTPANAILNGVDFSVTLPQEAPSRTGTISGTVTFLGPFPELEEGEAVYIGASPGLNEASTNFIRVTPDDLIENRVTYELTGLDFGTWFVSIFVYNRMTHRARFFGAYDGSVNLSEATPSATGIDFDADPTSLE